MANENEPQKNYMFRFSLENVSLVVFPFTFPQLYKQNDDSYEIKQYKSKAFRCAVKVIILLLANQSLLSSFTKLLKNNSSIRKVTKTDYSKTRRILRTLTCTSIMLLI